jgi:hypothetical protein
VLVVICRIKGGFTMLCEKCGAEIIPPETVCSACEQPKVQLLPPEERENFGGITIEQPQPEESYYRSETDENNHRVYVRQVQINSPLKSILVIGLIGIVLLFLVLVALPLAVLVMALFGFGLFLPRRSPK